MFDPMGKKGGKVKERNEPRKKSTKSNFIFVWEKDAPLSMEFKKEMEATSYFNLCSFFYPLRLPEEIIMDFY